MNKWQIICPLAAVALLVVWSATFSPGPNPPAFYAAAFQVSREVLATTNSTRLVSMDPALKSSLQDLLTSPANFAGMHMETNDQAEPAAKVLTLYFANEAGRRLDLKLRWDPKLKKFTTLGYTYPAPPPMAKPG
jgi:hypothetical protein